MTELTRHSDCSPVGRHESLRDRQPHPGPPNEVTLILAAIEKGDSEEAIAVANRKRVDGIIFFANDEVGNFVPRANIESFANAYFVPPTP